jgi:hypothetical protein
MKKTIVTLASAALLCGLLAPMNALAQGSLAPPGAPGPLFKTLEQVEPRIPIAGGTNTGSLIITLPGSYYLTGNRQLGGTAIFIRTNGVTIDLNGYSLLGGGANDGIRGEHLNGSPIERVVIRNGTIAGFGNGVRLIKPRVCRVEDLIASGNQGTGVSLDTDNAAGSVIGNIVTRCQMLSNSSVGIYLIGGNTAGDVCAGNVISHCTTSSSPGTAQANSGFGIWLFGSSTTNGGTSGNLIEYCTSANNIRSGFRLSASSARTVGNRLVGCTATLNGSAGFELTSSALGQLWGNTLTECLAMGNGSDGFLLSGNSGARANFLSRNQAVGNVGFGFRTSGSTGGLTIANFAAANTSGNYSLAATDCNGPFVTTSGTLTNSGNDAHFAANFSR